MLVEVFLYFTGKNSLKSYFPVADTNSLSFALKLCNDVSCAEQFIIGNTPIPLRSIIYASVSVGHGFQGVVDLLLEELFISVDSAGREKREVLITNRYS